MRLFQLAVVLPTMALLGVNVFGDEPGARAQRPSPQQYPQPYYQYQDDQQDQQQQLPPPMDPSQQYYCPNNCGQAPMPYPPVMMEPVPLPMPIEPPMIIQPMPMPIQPMLPPAILPPVIGRPIPIRPYGGGFGGGYYGQGQYRPQRPMPYDRGDVRRRGVGPRAMPYQGGRVRRMSTDAGCEILRGNNGEVLVLSKDDKVLYQDSSVHAEENASAMKTYYEKTNFEFCKETDVVPQSPSRYEI